MTRSLVEISGKLGEEVRKGKKVILCVLAVDVENDVLTIGTCIGQRLEEILAVLEQYGISLCTEPKPDDEDEEED